MHRLPREAYNSFHGNIAPVSGPDGSPRRLSLSLFHSFLFYLLSHHRLLHFFLQSSRPPLLSTADSLPAINPSATIRGSNCIINCVCPCTSRGLHSAARCTRSPRRAVSNRRFQDAERPKLSEIERGNRPRVSRPKNTGFRIKGQQRGVTTIRRGYT